MRIPEFKITDEKTKAALSGYVSLLAKDQTRVVTARLAEVNEAMEKGDLSMARKRVRGAAIAMMAIVKSIDQAAELTGMEEDDNEEHLLKADSSMYKTASRY